MPIIELEAQRDAALAEVERLQAKLDELGDFDASAALEQLEQLQHQFTIQRDNYIALFAAVFGGKLPDIDADPFDQARRGYAALAEIERLTQERDAAIAHRAATNAEIKRLHEVIKLKGFCVEDSVALHEFRNEVARLRHERHDLVARIAELEAAQGMVDFTVSEELAAAQAKITQVHELLGRLREWADTYGDDLRPHGADTYGEGVRACKHAIKAMISRVLV